MMKKRARVCVCVPFCNFVNRSSEQERLSNDGKHRCIAEQRVNAAIFVDPR